MHAHVITCVHLRQTIHSRSQVYIHMYFDFTGQLPDLDDSCYDKVALLIGNKHYERDNLKLNTPENDTQDMAGVLLSAGFKVVSLVNLNKIEMEMVRGKWRLVAVGGGVVLVVYLGLFMNWLSCMKLWVWSVVV